MEGKAFSAPPGKDLPSFKIKEATPFSTVGVDFAGPLFIRKEGKQMGKVYIGLFHFLSMQVDGRKKFKSIFALDIFDMNILSPGKQLGEFSVSLEFHSELLGIFASFVLSKCQWI